MLIDDPFNLWYLETMILLGLFLQAGGEEGGDAIQTQNTFGNCIKKIRYTFNLKNGAKGAMCKYSKIYLYPLLFTKTVPANLHCL